jgi:hypothetical protein
MRMEIQSVSPERKHHIDAVYERHFGNRFHLYRAYLETYMSSDILPFVKQSVQEVELLV